MSILKNKFHEHATDLLGNAELPQLRAIESLPGLVQRYLHTVGASERTIKTARLKQTGRFRTKPEQDPLSLEAEQYFSVSPPGFAWLGTITAAPFVTISAEDSFHDDHGSLEVRLWSTIPLGKPAAGPEVDHGEGLRFLAEIAWFPTAWRSEYLSWEEIDENTVGVTFKHGEVSATGTMRFENDLPVRFEAQRFFEGKLEGWSGDLSEYREIDGLKIPTSVKVHWHLPDGDFTYFDASITAIDFDADRLF